MKQRNKHPVRSDINSKIYLYYLATFFLIFNLINNHATFSQERKELHDYYNLFSNKEQLIHKKTFIPKNKNDLEFISQGIYSFYKFFVSSQDENHCYFYPSCSDYAILSIKKKGLFIGIFSAFDRLTRCNIYSSKKYPVQKGTGLFIDLP